MMLRPSCLICCQSLHSPLIPDTEQGEFVEQTESFDIFCEYMQLDPASSIQDEYRGKLFPFCASCSFQVYKLVEYHQEKVRILELLSQMVASMTTVLLESHSGGHEYFSFRAISPEDRNLIEQIEILRKKVAENYNPLVELNTDQLIAELSSPDSTIDFLCINQRSSRSLRSNSEDSFRMLENIVFPVEENVSRDDSIDNVESNVKGNNENHPHSQDGEPACARKVGRPKSKFPSKRRSNVRSSESKICDNGKRARTFYTQIGENLFSKENHIYTFEDNVFKCGDCPYTAKDRIAMNKHVVKSHVHAIPAIPEKSLEDFKIELNKYMLANKYLFEKDTKENIFRCCSCGYTSVLWSAMYNHIFKMHYRGERARTSTKQFVPTRPKGEVRKLSENEYEFLGIKYLLLPQGSHKCGLCGTLRLSFCEMQKHIRGHVDFLPETPDKSLEDCKLATNLYWLSRKFIFEKTGDSFTCSHGECYEVRGTWEEMYEHIRADHWSMEYAAQNKKKLKEPAETVRSKRQAGLGARTRSGRKAQTATNEARRKSTPAALPPNADTSVAASKDIPLAAQPIANTVAETSAAQLEKRWKGKKKKAPESDREIRPKQIPLADLETSPGHYAYRGFEFRVSDDGDVFYCDSCTYTCRAKYSLFKHINGKHIRNCNELVEVRPSEFLYMDKYRGTKDPDGRFRCRVEGCEFVTSSPLLGLLQVHMLKSHCEKKKLLVADDCNALQKKLEQQKLHLLSKCETGPGQYNYRGFNFHVVGDQFQCDSCSHRCSGETEKKIFYHISYKHVDPSQKRRVRNERLKIVQVRPDEFLVQGRFTVFRLLNNKFKCGVEDCKSLRRTRQSILRHIHQNHLGKPIICKVCDRVYQNNGSLRHHMALVHAQAKGQKCPTCSKSFLTALAFQTHLKTAHQKKGKTFVCDQCGLAYAHPGTLQDHIAAVHLETRKTFPCRQCGKIYHTRGSLSMHTRVDHALAGRKVHPCPVCQKEFKYKDSIKRHVMVVHEGKKSSEVYKRSQRSRANNNSNSGGSEEPSKVSVSESESETEEPTTEESEEEEPDGWGEQTTEESEEEETEEERLRLRRFMNVL